jgi:predicted nicotinamide N-methyase
MADRLRDGRTGRITDPAAFIRSETRIKPVPHAESIRLHLADEAMDLWQRTEEELGEMGLPPPFWAFAWAGGQALARYILDHEDLVAGKRVVDFACGSGLVGIAAMLAGASSCHCIDVDPFAIEAAKLNAAENGVVLSLEQDDITAAGALETDLFFCGDVFYDKEMATRVLGYLDRVLEKNTPVLVGDPGRSYLPRERLELLETYRVPIVGALEDAEVKQSSVFRLLP